MKTRIKELRAFLRSLEKRPDVQVTIAGFGPPASGPALEALRSEVPELAEFYECADGVHIEWRFVEPPGEGRICIPPLGQLPLFETDETTYMGFGDDMEARLLDETTEECGAWLLRRVGESKLRVVYACAAEGSDWEYLCSTVDEYLELAMKHGGVHLWQRVFMDDLHPDDHEAAAAVERFRAPPVPPSPIQPGVRVNLQTFAGGSRGQVVEVRNIDHPEPMRMVQVRTDEGGLLWVPVGNLKVLRGKKRKDAYELLRGRDWATMRETSADAVLGHLVHALYAIGTPDYWSEAKWKKGLSLPSNAQRAAGIMEPSGFSVALETVAGWYATLVGAGVDLTAPVPFEPKSDLAFNKREFRTDLFVPSKVFEGLAGGLAILAHFASCEAGVPGNALVDASLVEAVEGMTAGGPGGSSEALARPLAEALRCTEVLTRPSYPSQEFRIEAFRAELGGDVIVGAGY